MAKKTYTPEEIAANPDLQTMQDLGFDIGEDVVGPQGGDPSADPPPGDPPPGDPPPQDPPPGDPPADPPPDPPPGDPPPADPPPPSSEELQQQILSEMFGNTYSTLEEAKEGLGAQATELETLRQEKERLAQIAEGRPLGYANEGIALFNEFVKKTGIQNYGVFNKLMNTEVDKLDDLDVMVMQEVINKPALIGQESKLKAMFEKKYQLDPDQVEEDDLVINKLTLKSDAETARKTLGETKSGITLPEETPPAPPGGKPPLSEEEKTNLTKGWSAVTNQLEKEWKAFPLIPEGSKDPLLQFEIPAEVKQNLIQRGREFALENNIELNKENVTEIFGMMQKDLIAENLPKILHSVAEKVRGMTEEEYDKIYHNPSPGRNDDTPPPGGGPPQHEQDLEDIYEAEKEQLGG